MRNPPPYDPLTGKVNLPPSVQLRLRDLAEQGYKLAALRQVVDLTGAPIEIARNYIEKLTQPASHANYSE